MNIDDVLKLWDRFDRSGATEFHLEMEGVVVSLSSNKNSGIVYSNELPVSLTPAVASAVDIQSGEAATPVETNLGTEVKAPFVGTFYKAPSPEEQPFVSVGSKVKKGDTIGIIEAMKLMNEIKAPCDGEVTSILPKDGDLLEFDQVIMTIKG